MHDWQVIKFESSQDLLGKLRLRALTVGVLKT